jgi:hypothetical protein
MKNNKTSKKEKWLCPLCLGYDHPPNSKRMARYEAMTRLDDVLYDIFINYFYEIHRDPGEED